MSSENFAHKVLNYWHDALVAANFRDVAITASNHAVDLSDIEAGRLSHDLTADLFKEEAELNKKKKREKEHLRSDVKTGDEKVIDVIFALYPIRPRHSGNSHQNKFSSLLFVAGKLSEDGLLAPSSETLPWIPRTFLAPTENEIVIGTFDDFDTFLVKTPLTDQAKWSDVMKYADALFHAVISDEDEGSLQKDYARTKSCYVLCHKEDNGSGRYIEKLCKQLLKLDQSDHLPNLLTHIAEGIEPKIAASFDDAQKALTPKVKGGTQNSKVDAELEISPQQIAKQMKLHLGQMREDYGLAPSQRQALLHALQLDPGELIAINGPPGTGKTTLLQSIIASLWVGAALKSGTTKPPVILGCSTNNQAVLNILDSFAGTSGETPEILYQRWLPGPIKSYGLSFPSKDMLARDNFAERYHYAENFAVPNNPWPGLPAKMETQDYSESAKKHYLKQSKIFFPDLETDDIQVVVEQLHSLLTEEQRSLNEILDKVALLQQLLIDNSYDPFHETSEQIKAKLLSQTEGAKTYLALAQASHDQAKCTLERELNRQKQVWNDTAPKDFLTKIFSFLPSHKRARRARATQLYCQQFEPRPIIQSDKFEKVLAQCKKSLIGKLSDAERNATQAIMAYEKKEALRSQVLEQLQVLETLDGTIPHKPLKNISDVHSLLDRHHRYRLFHLAARYWEGRWLLEIAAALKSNVKLGGQAKQVASQRFQRWSMLTPCFIATASKAPNIFSYFDGAEGSLVDFIDMLIIDEAGQVSPEIGGPIFALAKKAVIVGDIYQIEPIWSAVPAVDKASLKKHGLSNDDVEQRGLSCASSSVMRLAGNATKWTLPILQDVGGLFLKEHRRCKSSIIAYCNELVYDGHLLPMRLDDEPNGVTPTLGYCHMAYQSHRFRKSYRNEGEARAVAEWIAAHQEKLEQRYSKKLPEILAIITPYKPQADLLRQVFQSLDLDLGPKEITIGTVHSLQGAERPIVLFSLTVGYEREGQTLFFDRGKNMLNVAVSRAQDSFLVFGDMRLLDPAGKLPSSILAHHLFANEGNEILTGDVNYGLATISSNSPNFLRLDTLAKHQEILKTAIVSAKKQLLIVSPFMTINALKSDGLTELLSAAVTRGVRVTVITSRDLNMQTNTRGSLRPNFLAAETALKAVGCEVRRVSRVHNKLVAVDEEWMIEGSFNWLSSVRDEKSPLQYREVSIMHRGPDVESYIQSEKALHGL